MEKYPLTVPNNTGYIVIIPSDKPDKCKILLFGHEYLFNLNKSDTDLKLAEKTLKEFPKTKWLARIGLLIAIVLALKELYILLKQ